jgi:hypothetical protein
VLKFFETSTRNQLSHEAVAGVKHHVALSVVGTQRLAESGYFRAKIAQEKLIQESPIPYSIVHATQFFEFLKGLADISVVDGKVRLPPVLFQPMAAEDVATAVAGIAVSPPVNDIVEIGGPEQFRLDELVRRRLATLKDPREVIADPNALYSGAKISEKTLVPGKNARLGRTRFEAWLAQPAVQIPGARPQPTGVAVAPQQKESHEKPADIATAYATGERSMGKYTDRRLSPTHSEIAQLAFSLYESRGRQNGRDIDDWLRAEQELMRHYA